MSELDVTVVIYKSPRGNGDSAESTEPMTAEQLEKYKSYAPREELKRIVKARKMLQQT